MAAYHATFQHFAKRFFLHRIALYVNHLPMAGDALDGIGIRCHIADADGRSEDFAECAYVDVAVFLKHRRQRQQVSVYILEVGAKVVLNNGEIKPLIVQNRNFIRSFNKKSSIIISPNITLI